MDENVPLHNDMRIFDALIGTDKHFESLILPTIDHSVVYDALVNGYAYRQVLRIIAENH